MGFDWKSPDYTAVFRERAERLAWIREAPGERVPPLKRFYRDNPAQFIDDWGMTFDPRNADVDLPTFVPFRLFPRQVEWIEWVMGRWQGREPGLTEKSRDCGVSWLAIALGCTLCLHRNGLNIGYGSRKEEYVDKLDSPKSLFYKARKFMEYLPPEFRGGWTVKDAPHMRIKFPQTNSYMSGEAGDNIGRGDRAALYFVDESAYLERPTLIDASLSATTNCRVDISSVNGMGNPFAIKRWSWPSERIFIFDWRDDPRKDDAWYAKQQAELDPVTLAQEVDRDYVASAEGVLIPGAWVTAAIDAHLKLGIAPTGENRGALDIADEGRDANAFAGVRGWLLEALEEWSGKGDDIFGTVERAFRLCDDFAYPGFLYDSDGLGAGARGDARIINERRAAGKQAQLDVRPFRGSEGVWNPEGLVDWRDAKHRDPTRPPRLNKDFFANRKAQAYWQLRQRFQQTYRAVQGQEYNPDYLISLSSKLPLLSKLTGELSQPTYSLNGMGKVVVDKAPDGAKSPNLADAVMIAYSRASREPMRINPHAVSKI